MKQIDTEKIEHAVRLILEAINENPAREGLLNTPKRVARFYKDFFESQELKPQEIVKTFFQEEKYNELILFKDINFHSLCEHHLLPFFGIANVAYLPQKSKLIGISKIARIVDYYAKRLQLQERMTQQIADTIYELVSPLGLIVVIEAEHLCLTMRGVKKPGSKIITSAIRGIFLKDIRSRNEALALMRSK